MDDADDECPSLPLLRVASRRTRCHGVSSDCLLTINQSIKGRGDERKGQWRGQWRQAKEDRAGEGQGVVGSVSIVRLLCYYYYVTLTTATTTTTN